MTFDLHEPVVRDLLWSDLAARRDVVRTALVRTPLGDREEGLRCAPNAYVEARVHGLRQPVAVEGWIAAHDPVDLDLPSRECANVADLSPALAAPDLVWTREAKQRVSGRCTDRPEKT